VARALGLRRCIINVIPEAFAWGGDWRLPTTHSHSLVCPNRRALALASVAEFVCHFFWPSSRLDDVTQRVAGENPSDVLDGATCGRNLSLSINNLQEAPE
jgi:hypothetical protein